MEIREALEKEIEQAGSVESGIVEAAPAEAVEQPTDGTVRDEKGRFAPKQKEISDQAPTEGLVETAGVPEQPPSSIEAPRSWSAEKKALWPTLPPDVQAYIAQRETELHNKLTAEGAERGRIAKEYGNLGQLIERERDYWAGLGFTPDAAMGQMIATQRSLDANPTAGILKFCESYKGQIDPVQIALSLCEAYNIHPAQLVQAKPQVDPQVQALQSQIQALQQHLAQQGQVGEQAKLAEAQNLVQSFATETDSEGRRLRPHFETVESEIEPHLIALMQQKPGTPQKELLAEAYERAVYANPQTRALLLKEQTAATEAQRANAVAQKAKAGASLTGAPGAALVGNHPKSIRGLLEAGLNGQL